VITFLQGILSEALPTQIVVEVGGVGYQVFIPLSSFDRLPLPGQAIKVLTHLQIREDAHVLYGFMTAAERDLFLLLLNNVSGVGPKLALAVLSGASVAGFKDMVVNNDIAALAKIRGLGKKTAERIALELRDKLGVAATWEAASSAHAPSAEERATNDAVLALISLGYKQVEAHQALKKIARPAGGSGSNAPVAADELVRQALKILVS